jgi:hypothetical protein
MQTHIENAFVIIDAYLPKRYVNLVLEKLKEDSSINKESIRNVRNKKSNRIEIIKAMVEVAKDNKKLLENLNSQIA